MLLPAQPLVLNGRNATPSSMQQWQHAAAQSPAPAAAAAAASHPRRVLSVVSGSRSLSQQLGAHPQQLASFLPVQQMNSKGPMEQVLGRSSGSIAAARSAAADAAGSALGLGASAASSGSMPAAAAAATTTNATAASEQGAAADLCSEYVDCLKKDSVTLPVMERNSSGAAAELVEYKILEKLGSGGFGTVYKVLRVAADSSSAASSNGSSTGASSSQEFAMKVFTVRTSRSQATTWTQCRQALSKQQQQSTVAAKQQQQQQPGLASQQQQGRVQAADGGPAASRLHTNGTEAEQQQQNQSQPAQASLQQQTFAAQHTAAEQHRATSTSSGDSGMSKDAPRWTSQQLDQQRLAVSDSSTFSQCDEIREMQEKLGHMQAARNLELQLMLLAKGDLRGASIARGNDSSMWLPATPEHELCSGVLRVQGWGQFSMQIEQLQVPVLVSELCSCMVADLLQLIRAVNNACGVQQVGLTREETRHLARQLVRALASMHKVDIVHRDIKPGDSGND
jgi:serine/threonine protein kinase